MEAGEEPIGSDGITEEGQEQSYLVYTKGSQSLDGEQ